MFDLSGISFGIWIRGRVTFKHFIPLAKESCPNCSVNLFRTDVKRCLYHTQNCHVHLRLFLALLRWFALLSSRTRLFCLSGVYTAFYSLVRSLLVLRPLFLFRNFPGPFIYLVFHRNFRISLSSYTLTVPVGIFMVFYFI